MSFEQLGDICMSDRAAFNSIHPNSLADSLHPYIVRLSGVNGDVGEAPRPLDIQDRDPIAMALVLLSVSLDSPTP